MMATTAAQDQKTASNTSADATADPNAAARQQLLRSAYVYGDILQDEAGDWVFWPVENRGYLSAYQLRWLADELDRRNEEPYG